MKMQFFIYISIKTIIPLNARTSGELIAYYGSLKFIGLNIIINKIINYIV